MANAPAAVDVRSSKNGMDMSRAGRFSSGAVLADSDATLMARRLFADDDIGEARNRAPIPAACDAGEPFMDIAHDRHVFKIAMSVERQDGDVAIADRGEHRPH